jgi:hypothetical protein
MCMILKQSLIIIIFSALLLMSACSLGSNSTSVQEPSPTQDFDFNKGVPIAVPTFTVPQPANINPGKFLGTVYISDKDNKYHREDCLNLASPSTSIPLQQAKIQGYTACPLCNP